jgi:hypothetical protein
VLNGFGAQAKRSRLFATGTTNRHIEQNDAILFAHDPIRLANGLLITVSAKEFHAR